MVDDFDPALYVRQPIIDVAQGVALGIALLSATPKPAPDNVKKSAKHLRAAVLKLQDAWRQNGRIAPIDKRPADVRADKAWGAFHARINAYAELPRAEYPLAKRAAEILDILFPDGLGFLALLYNAQWAECEKRLKLIEEEEFESDLETIAGPEFLAELKKAHHLYGQALGITRAADPKSPVNLSEPLRALAKAVVHYSLQLIAMLDDSEATSAAVRKALHPLDQLRAQQSERRSKQEPLPAANTESPVPDPSDEPK